MRSWRRRVVDRRPYLKRPPTPPAERLEEARLAAQKADEVHSQVMKLEPVVRERAAKAEKIHQENNLGPSIWRVMEGRRA